jgi:2-polyprenyl-6-methoxyphenol hydroxylase-like FAD-dependent oxidoreductase
MPPGMPSIVLGSMGQRQGKIHVRNGLRKEQGTRWKFILDQMSIVLLAPVVNRKMSFGHVLIWYPAVQDLANDKDTYDIAESWAFPGKVADALKVIEGWDQRPRDIIAMTPEAQLIDYKLLWRDPLPKWVSKHGRMMLVGDSAHPFLPTSGQGAGQAIEDAATVAICLELAGKDKVPLGLRTSEKLR